MKRRILILITLLLPMYAFSEQPIMLPNPVPVYTNGTLILNHPIPGYIQKSLPVVNAYIGETGCYIACYSRDWVNGAVSMGRSTFIMGLVRVPGSYFKDHCMPQNFSTRNISSDQDLANFCSQTFPACGPNCWGGNDTGGWLGIQKIEMLQ